MVGVQTTYNTNVIQQISNVIQLYNVCIKITVYTLTSSPYKVLHGL